MQVFYEEFGELMMEQPVIGLDFQTWLPVAIVPYILLLSFNLFNRWAERPGAENVCCADVQHTHMAK